MRRSKSKGFTLVELLVVIGIIAVLMSLLMPALGRARMSAKLVSCQSNFRQVYNAVLYYVNGDGKGNLPLASTPNGWGATGTNAETFIRLSQLMGTQFQDENRDKLNPVLTCVEANLESGIVWAPNLIRTIQFNPRAFPGYDQIKDLPKEYPARKLSSIKNGADKIAFYEGPQLPTWNMCPEPESIFLDGWRWNWGHMYSDPPSDGNLSRWESKIDAGNNRDDGWWVCSMRFRHMKNTTTPVAFFDGHVESRRIGEVRVREICINK
jgi:prepilin-type N-terminal cleavage/methylation domain-containing protein/prepilin-type processing-associated H-X9-DG protein